MSRTSKTSPGLKLLLLAGFLVTPFGAHAENDEEKLLEVPPAETDSAGKDYDYFFRVISAPYFPGKDASFAIKIYFSDRNATQAKRGFIVFKIRTATGKFWERSRALTAEEVETIWVLLENEEIFSLPAEQRRYPQIDSHRSRPGSAIDHFVYIDKIKHTKDEIARSPQASNPAGRVVARIGEIIKDFSNEFDKEAGQ